MGHPSGSLILTAWVSPEDGSYAIGCPLCRVWLELPLETPSLPSKAVRDRGRGTDA